VSFPPLITKPSAPVVDEPAFVLPRSVSEMAGKGRAKDAVTRGFLKPRDIETAEISEVEKIFVPLWRIEGSVDGFHIGLGEITNSRGRSRPFPTGGFRHHDGTLSVLARRGFAIDPSLKVKIPKKDLVPYADAPIDPSERVEPDVPRELAEKRARKLLQRKGEPRSALYAKVDVEIGEVTLCYYPLWVVRYRYGGEAIEGGPEVFFAAISGTTGKEVASQHPSALRSLGGKLRGLFGA
jgi:hypothetical protein